MKRIRIIPTLLLKGGGLVKTIKFKNPTYIGDPINAVKIFNEKEVDELILLDIYATRENREPNINKIAEIAGECFMPLGFGGGIKNLAQIKSILSAGVEKVILNSSTFSNLSLISDAADIYGSQSIVVSIDVKKDIISRQRVFAFNGTKNTGKDPVEFAKEMEDKGAGEIFLNVIDNDGTYLGYDIPLIKRISESISIPLIACGGARGIEDFVAAVKTGGASAVAAGSLFVFYGNQKGVLINFPDSDQLKEEFFKVIS